MNNALFAPLSNYREGASKLTGISNKTLSRIKADSENAVLAPRKPWRDRMELSDFDTCEKFINCKIKHNKPDKKLYIIKTYIFDFGFRTTISSLLFKKIFPTCMCALPTEPRSCLKFQCDINCFVIIIPLICIQPHVPLFDVMVKST